MSLPTSSPIASPKGRTRGILEADSTVHSVVFLFSIGGNVVAIGLAILLRCLSGTAMYDYNYLVFKEVLDPTQRAAIIRTVEALINTAIVPLALACLFSSWAGYLLLRDNARLRKTRERR